MYLDIPNIHSVRESYEAVRTLCLSNESTKWYSALENTQWLSNLSLIIKVREGLSLGEMGMEGVLCFGEYSVIIKYSAFEIRQL